MRKLTCTEGFLIVLLRHNKSRGEQINHISCLLSILYLLCQLNNKDIFSTYIIVYNEYTIFVVEP